MMNLSQIGSYAYGSDILPLDNRLNTVKHVYTNHELHLYKTKGEWEKRADVIRERIKVCGGLTPFPQKHSLNPKIFDRVECGEISVEKVIFESLPGFYVTGNLYRPLKSGKYPGILNTHGHWDNGRLEQSAIANNPLRAANLAANGFVALAIDMVGYIDSIQLSHRFWSFADELWGVGGFAAQLLNTIRSLDFLESLPDVDPTRIGCTGASGGGTQTFFLFAVDERVKAAVPVNMVSAHYQGGCPCENAPGLKIGTNTVEIASLFAPKPMMLTGCTGDWTKNLPEKEFPAVKNIYDLYGAGENVSYFYTDSEHNYNKETREAMYRFFKKVFYGDDKPVAEENLPIPKPMDLRVYPDNILPPGLICGEEVIKLFKNERKKTAEPLKEAGDTNILSTILAIEEERHFEQRVLKTIETDDFNATTSYITDKASGMEIPITRITPKVETNVLLIIYSDRGARNLLLDDKICDWLNDIMKSGYELLFADVFATGDHNKPYARAGRNHRAAAETDENDKTINTFASFNHTDAQIQISDVCQICSYAKNHYKKPISVVGFGKAGLWVSAALPFLCAEEVHADISLMPKCEEHYLDYFFVPGYLAAGGFDASKSASNVKSYTTFENRPLRI